MTAHPGAERPATNEDPRDTLIEAYKPSTPFLSCMGFSITARCPIACPHCIVEAGPRRREEMSLAEGNHWLEEVASYRGGHVRSVIFTGGEPFYRRTLLAGLLDGATARGLFSAVVTNAFWAKSVSRARDVLRALPGLGMLTVSTDEFHQRSIPLVFAKNALRAAQELGVPHNAAVCFQDPSDACFHDTFRELEALVGRDRVRPSVTFPAGRARRDLAQGGIQTTDHVPRGACAAADFPTIFPDGTVIACMGIVSGVPARHPLMLGSVREAPLDGVLDRAETNVLLHALRVWGPERLVQLLVEAGHAERLPSRWVRGGYCDLCYVLTSDGPLLKALLELAARPDFVRRTSYARLHYLGEDTMLERLGTAPVAQGDRP